MRLDHLLSKEHWPPVFDWWCRAAPSTGRAVISDGPRVVGVVLEGGTLTSSAAGLLPAPSTARRVLVMRRVWNGAGGSTGVVGTLLGPEGTGSWCHRLRPVGRGRLSLSGPPGSHIARFPGGGRGWVGS